MRGFPLIPSSVTGSHPLSQPPGRSHRVARAVAFAAVLGLASSLLANTVGRRALENRDLSFQPMPGPSGQAERFQARGLDYRFEISPAAAQLILCRVIAPEPVNALERGRLTEPRETVLRSLRLELVGADPTAAITGQTRKPGKINRLVGNKPAQWQHDLALYSRVHVESAYPGVDVVYYGNQQRLEYDFVVAPHGRPGQIALRFTGAQNVTIEEGGDLLIQSGQETVRQPKPYVYQDVDGKRLAVRASYDLRPDGTVGFKLGNYDRNRTLVIDPLLSYSTLFGGNSGDLALSVKLDGGGFIYVAGQTLSTQFPFPIPSGAVQPGFGGGEINGDAFVAKFDPSGQTLVYFTYLGGSGNDGALDLAVDPAGNAFVCGFTDSLDFPTTSGAFDRTIGGKKTSTGLFYSDAFIAKLNPTGAALVYSTYLGGDRSEAADAIAIDPAGNAYVTGYTRSLEEFPILAPVQSRTEISGPIDAFVAKLNIAGSALVYCSYLGGRNSDEGQGIAADAEGYAYVTGYSSSPDFPLTTNAFRTLLNGKSGGSGSVFAYDAFVARIAPSGGALLYSTFLGGANSDAGFRIALDADRNAFVTGGSASVDFPNTLTNVPGLSLGFTNDTFANYDAFLTRVNADGSLGWSSRFGGSRDDVGWDVAVDGTGRAFVVGITSSTNFPVLNAVGFEPATNARPATNTVFLASFSGAGTELAYSLQMGGSGDDMGYAVTVDPAGNAYLAGRTTSTNFPTFATALSGALQGGNDAFLAKIIFEPTLATALASDRFELRWRAFAPEYNVETSASSSPEGDWTPVPAQPVLSNGWHSLSLELTNQGSFFRLRRR